MTRGAPVLGRRPRYDWWPVLKQSPVLKRCYEGPSPGSRATHRSPAAGWRLALVVDVSEFVNYAYPF